MKFDECYMSEKNTTNMALLYKNTVYRSSKYTRQTSLSLIEIAIFLLFVTRYSVLPVNLASSLKIERRFQIEMHKLYLLR